MKVDLENVEAILLEKKIDPPRVQEIVRDLTKAAEEEKEERSANAGPKLKWEHVIIIQDKDGSLTGKELTGFVVQQKDGEDAGLILSKLCDAAKVQNETAKRKKNRLSTITEIFGHLKSKFSKEKNLRIKTKEPTRVLVTDDKFV